MSSSLKDKVSGGLGSIQPPGRRKVASGLPQPTNKLTASKITVEDPKASTETAVERSRRIVSELNRLDEARGVPLAKPDRKRILDDQARARIRSGPGRPRKDARSPDRHITISAGPFSGPTSADLALQRSGSPSNGAKADPYSDTKADHSNAKSDHSDHSAAKSDPSKAGSIADQLDRASKAGQRTRPKRSEPKVDIAGDPVDGPLVCDYQFYVSGFRHREKLNASAQSPLSLCLATAPYLYIARDDAVSPYIFHRDRHIESVSFGDNEVVIELQNEPEHRYALIHHNASDAPLREHFRTHPEWRGSSKVDTESLVTPETIAGLKRQIKRAAMARRAKETAPEGTRRSSRLSTSTRHQVVDLDHEDDSWEFKKTAREDPASFSPPLRAQFGASSIEVGFADFKTLYNNDWVNDTIIDFFVQYELADAKNGGLEKKTGLGEGGNGLVDGGNGFSESGNGFGEGGNGLGESGNGSEESKKALLKGALSEGPKESEASGSRESSVDTTRDTINIGSGETSDTADASAADASAADASAADATSDPNPSSVSFLPSEHSLSQASHSTPSPTPSHTPSLDLAASAGKTYAFNSFFFRKLTSSANHYANVRRWLAKMDDVMSYDSVVIPINENSHWYGCVIRGLPGLLARAKRQQSAKDAGSSFDTETETPLNVEKAEIFVFDSLSQQHKNISNPLKSFIIDYCAERHQVEVEKAMILVKNVSVPKQNNFNDCGIHVILNVRAWARDPAGVERYWRHPKRQDMKRVFPAASRVGSRRQLIGVLQRLHGAVPKGEAREEDEEDDDVMEVEEQEPEKTAEDGDKKPKEGLEKPKDVLEKEVEKEPVEKPDQKVEVTVAPVEDSKKSGKSAERPAEKPERPERPAERPAEMPAEMPPKKAAKKSERPEKTEKTNPGVYDLLMAQSRQRREEAKNNRKAKPPSSPPSSPPARHAALIESDEEFEEGSSVLPADSKEPSPEAPAAIGDGFLAALRSTEPDMVLEEPVLKVRNDKVCHVNRKSPGHWDESRTHSESRTRLESRTHVVSSQSSQESKEPQPLAPSLKAARFSQSRLSPSGSRKSPPSLSSPRQGDEAHPITLSGSFDNSRKRSADEVDSDDDCAITHEQPSPSGPLSNGRTRSGKIPDKRQRPKDEPLEISDDEPVSAINSSVRGLSVGSSGDDDIEMVSESKRRRMGSK
ncbi:hypothetical protein DICA1_E09934 [Diutina catenulata]